MIAYKEKTNGGINFDTKGKFTVQFRKPSKLRKEKVVLLVYVHGWRYAFPSLLNLIHAQPILKVFSEMSIMKRIHPINFQKNVDKGKG